MMSGSKVNLASRCGRASPHELAGREDLATEPAAAARTRERAMLAGVMLVTAIAYLRCLGNGFVYDDEAMLVSNRYVQQWGFLGKELVNDLWWFRDPLHLPQSSRYRPLVGLWFGLNYHLLGINPAAWHVAALCVHLVAVWLIFKITARLTADRFGALLAALLFGVMPAHVQTVVWTSSVSLLLSGTLELAALYLFLTRMSAPRAKVTLAAALFAGALLSHESAVIFPGLIAAYVFLIESRNDRARIVEASRGQPGPFSMPLRAASPFVVVAAVYMAARRLILGFFLNGPSSAFAPASAQVLMTIPRVMVSYLVLLVIPSLAGDPHRQLFVSRPASAEFVMTPASMDFCAPVILLIVMVGAFLWLIRTSPRRRLYLFCAAWVGIALSPMMSLGSIYRDLLVQDGYLYFVSAGWCVMAGDWAGCVARAGVAARRLVWGGALAVAAIYAAALWQAEHIWHDDVTLFSRCVQYFPESMTCHRELGLWLEQRRELQGAERELKIAVSLDPRSTDALAELAGAEALLGRYDEAGRMLSYLMTLQPYPKAEGYAFLAEVYGLVGETAQSEAALERARSLPGGQLAAGLARAKIKLARGDGSGAEQVLRGLSARFPDDYHVWTLMGSALAAQNRDDEALSAFTRALAFAPPDPAPHVFTAQLLHTMGRDREALEQCRLALLIAPDDGNARSLMSEIGRELKPR